MLNVNTVFDRRYFYWRLSEWEREIKNAYPFLRLIKEDSTIQVMERLSEDEKVSLAKALTKRKYKPDRIFSICGETLTDDEIIIIDHFLNESFQLHNIYTSNMKPEDFNYHVKINKKKFKQYIIEALLPLLGNDVKSLGGGEYAFCTLINQWEIYTNIDLGGSRFNLCYDHAIKSKSGNCIADRISLLSWLGISGQTQWQYLSNDDLKTTTESLAILCEHFITAVPSLLDGIPSD